jgi:hypothetical protein
MVFPVIHVPLNVCAFCPKGENAVLHWVFKLNSGPATTENWHLKAIC